MRLPIRPKRLFFSKLNKRQTNWIISIFSFIYVVVSFGLTGVPEFSRLALYSACSLLIFILFYIGKLKIPYWVLILGFFYAYIAVPAIVIENTPFDILGKIIGACIGSICIGLFLYNKILRYKVVVYGALTAAFVNIVAINMGIDTAPIFEKGRFSGLLGNPNNLSMSMAFAGFMVWLIPERFSRSMRLFGIFIAFYGMYISGSRKGLILAAILLLLVLMSYIIKLNRVKQVFIVTTMLLCVAVSYTWLADMVVKHGSDLVVIDRISRDLSGQNQSLMNRQKMIRLGYDLWKESPIIGYGIGKFAILSQINAYAHNNYIELAVSGGIIALLLYYSVHLVAFINAFKQPLALRLRKILFILAILIIDTAAVSFYDKATMCTLVYILCISADGFEFI